MHVKINILIKLRVLIKMNLFKLYLLSLQQAVQPLRPLLLLAMVVVVLAAAAVVVVGHFRYLTLKFLSTEIVRCLSRTCVVIYFFRSYSHIYI